MIAAVTYDLCEWLQETMNQQKNELDKWKQSTAGWEDCQMQTQGRMKTPRQRKTRTLTMQLQLVQPWDDASESLLLRLLLLPLPKMLKIVVLSD